MDSLHSIEKELLEFEKRWGRIFCAPETELQFLWDASGRQSGGRIRPKLVFLTAGMLGGITEESFRMALLVELLHFSSLIHDDVIDQADKRRGAPSLNRQYNNKTAVLLGDFFLSEALRLMSESRISEVFPIVSDTVRALTTGELQQLFRAGELDMEETVYEQIVSRKTAALIQASILLGALSSQGNVSETPRQGSPVPEQRPDSTTVPLLRSDFPVSMESLRCFGLQLGSAFQYKDDWKDFQPVEQGKGWGNDIREQQPTLPVIYAYRQLNASEQADFSSLFRQAATSETALLQVMDRVRKAGGVEALSHRIGEMGIRLRQSLLEFPDNPYRTALGMLIKRITDTGADCINGGVSKNGVAEVSGGVSKNGVARRAIGTVGMENQNR